MTIAMSRATGQTLMLVIFNLALYDAYVLIVCRAGMLIMIVRDYRLVQHVMNSCSRVQLELCNPLQADDVSISGPGVNNLVSTALRTALSSVESIRPIQYGICNWGK